MASNKGTKSRTNGRQSRMQPLAFVEPMKCHLVRQIPEGPKWSYEIKLDGYRIEAGVDKDQVKLFTRRANDLSRAFPTIAQSLRELPPGTLIDGEVVVLDTLGKSDFRLLQNYRSNSTEARYYAFDVLVEKGRSLLMSPLEDRRAILDRILPRNDFIGISAVEYGTPNTILQFAKEHRLEGIIAKRVDSKYEPGQRSGAWTKTRLMQSQEFVIGGYTPGTAGFDAIIVGFYREKDLLFASPRIAMG